MKFFLINIFLLFIAPLNILAQTDWNKWGKAEPSYTIKDETRVRDYNFSSDGPGDFVLKTFVNTYWFFISDVDGDNCPFRPSCSAFFIDAVKETNILQGSLMFFDRFTRDLNLFKDGNYPRSKSNHYYDPASLYSLASNRIKYIPPNELVSSE